MSLEKALEKRLTNEVKKMKGLALKFWCVSFTGFPDRVVLIPLGKIFFIEFKDTGKKLSKRQELVHKLLIKLGFQVWVIDTQELLTGFLNAAKG
ncbi:MAG: VRR-NUC domain-containing protein [Acinetobacter sp.]|nr:MAG: VRR-NUC domain-containing protein [Acinetobacter sp.]